MRRRDVLILGVATIGVAAPAVALPADEAAAFAATTFDGALRALGSEGARSDAAVSLQSLDLVEDGATVEVTAATRYAGAQRLLVLVEKNPNPLAATFDFGEAVAPQFTLRLKVAESCAMHALALRVGQPPTSCRRPVAVTIGGCGDGEIAGDLPPSGQPPQPTRMRLQRQGEGAVVRLLMSHPMETGLRKDAAGRPVPAWFIRDVRFSLNGAVVMTAGFGTGVSKNPYLQFTLTRAQAGDVLAVAWTDTRGASREDRAVIA